MTGDEADGPAVELIGISKCYGKTTAGDDLTLAIPRGATFGLIGPNGAGKSTAIRMLMGLLAPSAGEVRVLGIDVASDPARVKQRVGYVPERHDIYPWMTVGEVIAFTRPFYETWDEDSCR